MKTIAPQPHSSDSYFHSSKPFFNKSGEGTYLSNAEETEQPFFSPSFIQPKLTVGQPNDQYERQADEMADKVMRMDSVNSHGPANHQPAIQRKCAACAEEEGLQTKPDIQMREEYAPLQTKLNIQRQEVDQDYCPAPEESGATGGSGGGGQFTTSGGATCPNSIIVAALHPVSHRFTHSTHGPLLQKGVVAEMYADLDNQCTTNNFNGTTINESVTISRDTCASGTSPRSGGTFTVGAGKTDVGRNWPARLNTFYDFHLLAIQDTPAAIGRWRSKSCDLVRDQTYSCGGTDISQHQIESTIRPVSSGDPNITTTKRDVNSCLSCP